MSETAGPGSGPEPGPAPSPEPGPELFDATYRVTPPEIERAIERTGAKYVADFAGLYDRISAELGKVYEGQLAAKDETIATQREVLATQAERVAEQQAAIAELRRRAEAAKAELSLRSEKEAEAGALFRRRIEQERKNRAGMQATQDAPGASGGAGADDPSTESAAGLWARLVRWWRG